MIKLAMRSVAYWRGNNIKIIERWSASTVPPLLKRPAIAAVCSIADKFPKADVWKINAEKAYHEDKTDA